MFKKLFILPAAFFAFACSGNDKKVDDALNADLATAAQANPYSPLDSISAAERAGIAAAATAPALTSTATAPRRSTPVRRTASRSSSYPVYSAPAPQRERVIKHTKRDAAIGAVAGGVLGAAVSRNKVKGAIIGGAAGAIIGGVIGNNVDVERRRY